MPELNSPTAFGVRSARPPAFLVAWVAAIGFVTAASLIPGWAQAGAVHIATRLQCMACHAGPDRFVHDPETGKIRNVTIDMDAFHQGDHAETHCLECHTEGFDLFPHVHMKTYTCMDCHPREDEHAADDEPYEFHRIQEEFESTVHYTEYKDEKEKCCGTAPPDAAKQAAGAARSANDKQRFTCEHCHDPHYFKATARIERAQLIMRNDNEPCLRCHADDATGPLADPAEPSMVLAHAYLPHVELHMESTRCVDCHSSVKTTVAHDLPEGKGADQGCNSCHSINSVLMGRLYRYEPPPVQTLGFHNATMLPDSYIMGAHRHWAMDWATYVLVGVSTLLILVHSGLRLAARRRRTHRARGSVKEGLSDPGGAG